MLGIWSGLQNCKRTRDGFELLSSWIIGSVVLTLVDGFDFGRRRLCILMRESVTCIIGFVHARITVHGSGIDRGNTIMSYQNASCEVIPKHDIQTEFSHV